MLVILEVTNSRPGVLIEANDPAAMPHIVDTDGDEVSVGALNA